MMYVRVCIYIYIYIYIYYTHNPCLRSSVAWGFPRKFMKTLKDTCAEVAAPLVL